MGYYENMIKSIQTGKSSKPSGTKKSGTGNYYENAIADIKQSALSAPLELQTLPTAPEASGYAKWQAKTEGRDTWGVDWDEADRDMTARQDTLTQWETYLKVAEENYSAAAKRYNLTGDESDLKVAQEAQKLYEDGYTAYTDEFEHYQRLYDYYQQEDAPRQLERQAYLSVGSVGEDGTYTLTSDYGDIYQKREEARAAGNEDMVQVYNGILDYGTISDSEQAALANQEIDKQIEALKAEGTTQGTAKTSYGRTVPTTVYIRQAEIDALEAKKQENTQAGAYNEKNPQIVLTDEQKAANQQRADELYAELTALGGQKERETDSAKKRELETQELAILEELTSDEMIASMTEEQTEKVRMRVGGFNSANRSEKGIDRLKAFGAEALEVASSVLPFTDYGKAKEKRTETETEWIHNRNAYLTSKEMLAKLGGGDVGNAVVENAVTQIASGGAGMVKMVDDALGLDPQNSDLLLLGKLADQVLEEKEAAEQRLSGALQNKTQAEQVAAQLGVAVLAAIPEMVMAIYSGGASAAGSAALEARTIASNAKGLSGILQNVSTAIRGMVDNPQYWTSFVNAAGSGYVDAVESGAGTADAIAYSLINGTLNAAIEIGGGIQTLPGEVESANTMRELFMDILLKSPGGEAAEEVGQGLVERCLQSMILGQDKKLFSVKDREAIISVYGMLDEAAGGFVVGLALGGPTGLVNIRSASEAQAWTRELNNEALRLPEAYRPEQRDVKSATVDSAQEYYLELVEANSRYKLDTEKNAVKTETTVKQNPNAKKLEVLKGRDQDVVVIGDYQYSVTAKPDGITARVMKDGETVFSATYKQRADAVKALQAWNPETQEAPAAQSGAESAVTGENPPTESGKDHSAAAAAPPLSGEAESAEAGHNAEEKAPVSTESAEAKTEEPATGEQEEPLSRSATAPLDRGATEAEENAEAENRTTENGSPSASGKTENAESAETAAQETESGKKTAEPKNEAEAEVMRILSEPVSNKKAERIFSDTALRTAFEELTGVSLKGMTNSEMRAAIKGQGETYTVSENVGRSDNSANEENIHDNSANEGKTAGTQEATERKPGLVESDTLKKLRREKKITSKTMRELDVLGRQLGVEIEMAEEIRDAEGYLNNAEYQNGRIRIAVNSEDPVSAAVVHEAVHRIKEADPESFQSMAESVIGTLRKESATFKEDFDRKAKDYGWMDEKGNFTAKTAEADTLEEMVAQGMGYIAEHTDVLEKLARKDRSFVQRILDSITDIIESMRGYEDFDSGRSMYEEDVYEELGKHLGELQGKLETALRAGEDESTEMLEPSEKDYARPVSGEEEAKFSRMNNTKLMEEAREKNGETGNVTEEELDTAAKIREEVKALLDGVEEYLPADVEGNVIMDNNSYSKSVENHLQCIRSLVLDQLANAVSEGLGRPLTFRENLYVTQMAGEYTDMVECAYCYVAADRKMYGESLRKYLETRDAAVSAHKQGETEDWILQNVLGIKPGEKKRDNKTVRGRMRQWFSTADNGEAFLSAKDLAGFGNASDEISAKRASLPQNLRKEFDMATDYAQHAARAKKRGNYVAYDGNILEMTKNAVKKLNSQYGLRMYSYSDFSPAFILENMQEITDAAVMGLKVLAYTKEPDFVKIFGASNANINISIHAIGTPDANGEFHMDGMQGADWETAKELRQKSIEDGTGVGITFVAESDEQVEWALRQDWIDVVIPFHSVYGGGNLAAEIFGWKNYKAFQEDKKISALWKNGKGAGKKSHITPPMHGNDLIRYIDACTKNSLTPRFSQWLTGLEEYQSGAISEEQFREMNPYYMKLVNETRRSYDETTPVKPVFETDAVESSVQRMVERGGYQETIGGTTENMREIAGELAGKINEGEAERWVQRQKPQTANEELTKATEGLTGSGKRKASKMHEESAAEALKESDEAEITAYGRKLLLKLSQNKHGTWGAGYDVEYDGVHKLQSKVVDGATREEAIANLDNAMREEFDKPVTAEDIEEYEAMRGGNETDAVQPQMVFDEDSRPSRAECEQRAEAENFPMLTDEQGNEQRAVPYWTWVKTADRGNYGVVTAISKEDPSKLIVWFVNKKKGTDWAVEYDPAMLTVEDTRYQTEERTFTDEEAPAERNEEDYLDPRDFIDLSQMMRSRDAEQIAAAEKVLEQERNAEKTLAAAEREVVSWMTNGRPYDPKLDAEETMEVVDGRVRLRNGELIEPFEGMTAEETLAKLQGFRQRMQEEAASRKGAEEWESRREAMTRPGRDIHQTATTNALGVHVAGSLAENWDQAENFRKNAQALKKLDKQIARAEKEYGDRVRKMAKSVFEGNIEDTDIPKDIYDKVKELEQMYRFRENGGAAEQQRKAVRDRAAAEVEALQLDDESYNPKGVKGVLKSASKLIMNNRTMSRVFQGIFGADVGARVNNYITRPLQKNIAEKIRFKNRMYDEVREITDKTGKARKLTREESAYAQQMLEGEGFRLRMNELQGTDKAAVEEHIKLFRERMELQKQYAEFDNAETAYERWMNKEITRAEAERDAGSAELLEKIIKLKERQAAASPLRGEAEKVANGILWAEQATTNMLNDNKADMTIIANAVKKYQHQYELFYDLVNEHLVMHGEPEIGFIRGYAPHMQTKETQSKLAEALNLLGIRLDGAMALPASIAGRTMDFKPSMRWNPHFQHRNATSLDNIDWDIVGGYESYVDYLGDIIYHTDDILKLRAMANYYRRTFGSEEMAENIELAQSARTEAQKRDFLQGRTDLWHEGMTVSEMDKAIEDYVEKQYKNFGRTTDWSEFTTWLDNEANLLAGKQSMQDRALEAQGGRNFLGVPSKAMTLMALSKIGKNVSTILNQTAQLSLITTKLGEKYVGRAIADMASGRVSKEHFKERSDFITGKQGVQRITSTNYQKFTEWLFKEAGFVDETISTLAARGEYLRQLDKGVDEEIAMSRADDFARSVMGSRQKGERPQGFESKNAIAQMLHVFQVEAMNTLDYMITDMPQEIKDIRADQGKWKAAGAAAAAVVGYLLRAFTLNRLTDEVYGGTPAPFDMLGITADFFASGYGIRTNEFLWKWVTKSLDDLEEFDAGRGLKQAGEDIVADIPFVENAAALLGIGDQKMPTLDVAGIYEGGKDIVKGLQGEDGEIGGGDADMRQVGSGVIDVLSNAPMGNQARKTILGAVTMAEGGKYSNGKLQYAVDGTAGNWARALLFGRNALPENEDYYRSESSALSTKLTAGWEMLTGSYSPEDAYDLMTRYRELDDYKGAERSNQQRQLIASTSLSDDDKLELWQTLKSDDENDKKYRVLRDEVNKGVSFTDLMSVYNKYATLNEDDDMTAAEKATELARYIDTIAERKGWGESVGDHATASDLKETFKFFSMVPAEASTYEGLTDAGLSSGKAAELTTVWANGDGDKLTKLAQIDSTSLTEEEKWSTAATLTDDTEKTVNADGSLNEYGKLLYCQRSGMSYGDYAGYRAEGVLDTMVPMLDYMDEESAATAARAVEEAKTALPEGKSLSQTGKAIAVAQSGIEEEYKMAYLEDTLEESTYHLIEMGSEYGVTPELWAQFKSSFSRYDNGNGYISSDEAEACIKAMSGLDNSTRAALWSTVTGYKNNPFDKKFGATFYKEYKAWEKSR